MSVTSERKRREELAAVRQWAEESGISCPKHGRIPDQVYKAYTDAGHTLETETVSRRRSRKAQTPPARVVATAGEIRKWAQKNGVKTGGRGRIAKQVREAYLATAFQTPTEEPTTPESKRRLEVRFDPKTLTAWPVGKRRTNTIGTVVHYVENPVARTPSGGKFTSRRFTIVIDGERWVGQTKNGTDVVRLRPESEALANA